MFNLSKIINNVLGINKKAARESELEAEREKQGLSSGEEVGEAALQVDRTEAESPVLEKSLEEKHANGDDAQTIEASIGYHDGIVARQPEKTDDYGDVHPMAVASELWDARARDLYKKELAKISNEKSLLDKYMGDRTNVDLRRKGISESHQGLANNPQRFESFGSSPVEDAKENLKTIDKPAKINKIASGIMDLDAMRFAIEYDAVRNGGRSDSDLANLSKIREAKKRLLEELHSV